MTHDEANYRVVRVNVGRREPEREGMDQVLERLFGSAVPAVPDPAVWETDRAWYHGGTAGLEPGELILPWDETGSTAPDGETYADAAGFAWVTTDPAVARWYAAIVPDGGDLYQVRPIGLHLDIDRPEPHSQMASTEPRWRRPLLAGMGAVGSWSCRRAEITTVLERGVPPEARGSYRPAPRVVPPLVHRTAWGMQLPPPRDPGRPYRICCVCHGNICRSPTAEVVLRDQLARAGLSERVTVDSAGIRAERGKPMDPPARALLRRRGYDDGAAHRGRQFDVSWLAERDLVLAMDASNLAVLRAAAAPADRDRVRLFGEIAGLGGAQVPNPWHGTDADFARVLAMIETGMAAIVSQVAVTAAEGTPPA